MVLEALISVSGVRRNPLGMLWLSFVLSSIALWVGYFTFPRSASVMALTFVTMGLIPVMYKLFASEEESEIQKPGWCGAFLTRHFDMVAIYAFFFLGVVFSYAFWYVVLPAAVPPECGNAETVSLACIMPAGGSVFAEQEQTWSGLNALRESATAKVIAFVTGQGAGSCLGAEKDLFGCTEFIFANNALVLGLAVLFSFMYGAGAIFLLSWNASVIGIFIGKEIAEKHLLAGIMRAVGYLPHGSLEISAYFIGAIAGGIVSAALAKRKYRTHEFEIIAKDTLVLLILAYALLYVAAVVEAWLIVGG